MRRAASLLVLCCAGRALAQHEGHGAPAATSQSPRFSFSATAVYSDHGSNRGARKTFIRDVEHFQSGAGTRGLTFRGMTSLAGLFDHEGSPSLLQTGGTYQHAYIHDRQHPHDLVMEAAAELRGRRGFIYAAPIGSPALGPATYMHRPSAGPDAFAPIGHHWQDASHVSYGVLSAGATAGPVTVEASAFNARESDFKHAWPDFSHGRLDSFSGRISASRDAIGLSAWWGYLKSHDPIAPGMQMHRYGASASFDARGGQWSSLAVWGMNVHHHDGSSHAILHGDAGASPHVRSSSALLESNLKVGSNYALFGRAERVMKNGEELGFLGGDLMSLHEVRTAAVGATRQVSLIRQLRTIVGARGTITLLPQTLELAYGTRRPAGLDVFLQVRQPR